MSATYVATSPRVFRYDGSRQPVYYYRRVGKLIENGFWVRREVRRALGCNLQRAIAQAAKLDEEFEGMRRGESPRVNKDATVREFADLYLARVRDEWQLLSWPTIRAGLKAFTAYCGERILRHLTRADIEGFLARRKQAVRPATVNTNRGDIRRMLQIAVEMGYAEVNVADGVRPVSGGRLPARVPSSEEIARVLDHLRARGSWLYSLVVTLIATGARLSEALGLTWNRVSFKTGRLVLARRKVNDELELPLTGPLAATLNALWIGQGMSLTGPVFPDENGRVRDRKPVYAEFKRIAVRLGLPAMHLKGFRKVAATVVAERTGDIRAASATLGHSSVTTTERAYIGRQEAARAQGAAALGGYLEELTGKGQDGAPEAAYGASVGARKEARSPV